MTNPNKTHLLIVLDCSSSMGVIKEAMESALNEFLLAQRALPGELTVDLVTFSTTVDNAVRVNHGNPIKMICSGMTALEDAIGQSVTNLGKLLALLPEDERPGKVIVSIITDGEENMSKTWTVNSVRELIEHQTKVYNWEFIYLGANQDAVKVGMTHGIHTNTNYLYSVSGTRDMSRSLNATVAGLRQ